MSAQNNDKTDISHHEADKRMENMAKLAKEPEHAFQIENLRAQYKDELQKNENDRITSRIYHSTGERAGLHQQSVQEVDQIYEDKKQKSANKNHVAAKDIYTNHANTASKNFSESKLKDVLKHDFEQNKEASEKETIGVSENFNLSKEKDNLKFHFSKNKDLDMER